MAFLKTTADNRAMDFPRVAGTDALALGDGNMSANIFDATYLACNAAPRSKPSLDPCLSATQFSKQVCSSM